LGQRAIDELEHVACQGLKPDLTILIRVAQKHVDRAKARNAKASRDESRIELEGRAFFARVRREFDAIARREPRRVRVVDGDRTVEEIHKDIWDLVASRVTRKR